MSELTIESSETRVSEKWFGRNLRMGMTLGDLRAVVAACETMPDTAVLQASGLASTSDQQSVWFSQLHVRSTEKA